MAKCLKKASSVAASKNKVIPKGKKKELKNQFTGESIKNNFLLCERIKRALNFFWSYHVSILSWEKNLLRRDVKANKPTENWHSPSGHVDAWEWKETNVGECLFWIIEFAATQPADNKQSGEHQGELHTLTIEQLLESFKHRHLSVASLE